MRFFTLLAFAALNTCALFGQSTSKQSTIFSDMVKVQTFNTNYAGLPKGEPNTILVDMLSNVTDITKESTKNTFVLIQLDEDGAFREMTPYTKDDAEFKTYKEKTENRGLSYGDYYRWKPAVDLPEAPNENSLYYSKNTFKKMLMPLGTKGIDIDLTKNPFGAPDVGFPSGLGGATSQVTDPVTGNVVIAGDIKYKKDKTKKSSVHLEHRVITFNKQGELINNVEINTETPYRVRNVLPIYADYLDAEDGQYDYVAVLMGGSSIKKGPETKKTMHKIIVVSTQTGEVVSTTDIDLGAHYPRVFAAFSPVTGVTSHFFHGGQGPKSAFGFLTISKDGVLEHKVYGEDSPEFKALVNKSSLEMNNTTFSTDYFTRSAEGVAYIGSFTTEETQGDKLMAATGLADRRERTARPVTSRDRAAAAKSAADELKPGDMLIAFNAEGKLVTMNSVPKKKYKLLSNDQGFIKLLAGTQVTNISALGVISKDGLPEGYTAAAFNNPIHVGDIRTLYFFGQKKASRGLEMVTLRY